MVSAPHRQSPVILVALPARFLDGLPEEDHGPMDAHPHDPGRIGVDKKGRKALLRSRNITVLPRTATELSGGARANHRSPRKILENTRAVALQSRRPDGRTNTSRCRDAIPGR